MGWSSGSRLMSSIIETIEEHVDLGFQKVEIYKDIITAFEEMDCDTLMECMGESVSFEKAMKELYPEYFEEED